MQRLICVLAVLCAAIVVAVPASATTIYSDSFNISTEDVALNGVPVEVGGQDWITTYAMVVSGTNTGNLGAQIGSPWASGVLGKDTALLPFVPQNGKVYDLSADISVSADATSWACLGFVENTDAIYSNSFLGSLPTANMWVFPDGSSVDFTGTYVYANSPGSAVAGTNFGVRLDTTGGDGNWKLAYLTDGVLHGTEAANNIWTPVALADQAKFQYCGFGGLDTGSAGYVKNFSLTETPEPSTLVLLSMGVLSLLAYAWRRRK